MTDDKLNCVNNPTCMQRTFVCTNSKQNLINRPTSMQHKCLTAAGQTPHGNLCLQKTCMKEPSTYFDEAVVTDLHASFYLSLCMLCMLPTPRL